MAHDDVCVVTHDYVCVVTHDYGCVMTHDVVCLFSAEPEPEKPIQALEITSPFINYKVSPVPIPAET